MKQASFFVWSTFLALVASTVAWLPGAVIMPRGVVLQLSRSPLPCHEDGGIVAPDTTDVVPPSISRRNLFRVSLVSAIGVGCGNSYGIQALAAYTIDKVDPNEYDIYSTAQNLPGRLRVLWIGSGAMDVREGGARSGVYKNLFRAGNDVTAVDLLSPKLTDLRDAKTYAAQQGYKLHFQKGDATKLKFEEDSFDVVVCSLFLCQDFDPAVVVSGIQRVLKPGGQFGFYEHVEDIDRVVVGKIFGETSIIKLQAYPEKQNILAGVVRKA